MYRLGVDIGGTKINIGILDEQKELLFKHTEKIGERKSFEEVIKHIGNTIETLLLNNSISKEKIAFCGIGVPGTVDKHNRIALKVPNLNWEKAPVAERIEDLTRIRTSIVQDSRAAAWGEYVAGNGINKQAVICVTLGTGIGTGIVLDGKIFDGALGGAGELGHTVAVFNGRPCGCGKKGCLEKYVAGMGIGITAKEVFGDEFEADYVFDLAHNGDKRAVEIIDEAIIMLGNAMVAAINLLSPDCLLFSGGMSSQTALFVSPLIKYIKEHAYSITSESIYIDKAGLGENAPLFGAALLPLSKTTNGRTTKKVLSASG